MSTLSKAVAPLLVTPADVKVSSSARVFLDASWFMPGSHRKPRDEWASKRIPTARFLDLDAVASEHPLGLKHMLPSSTQFALACESLGISRSTHVILYDTYGVFSAPRALFTFRAFGHTNSSVLDGGLPRWEEEGLSVESILPSADVTTASEPYTAPDLDTAIVKGYEQMVSNASKDPANDSTTSLVFDARPKGRYLGTDPEPRPGLSSGHMPHSLSLPFSSFLENPTGNYTVFKSPEAIRTSLLAAVGGNEQVLDDIMAGKRSIINTCGSGMTACIVWLGLQLLGVRSAVYDESWTGYALRKDSKIVTGVPQHNARAV